MFKSRENFEVMSENIELISRRVLDNEVVIDRCVAEGE